MRMAPTYDHPRRVFNPEVTARFGRPTFPVDKLVKYSPKYGWARLFNFPFGGSHWRPRMHTVVVSIDGPCRVNDSSDPDSRAAWSVCFGPNSVRNNYGLVSRKEPQTNTRAVLEGVRQAVIKIRIMKINGEFDNPFNPFKEVIIRTTSEYVVKAFHEFVWEWQANDWHRSQGDPIAHVNLVQEIHHMICDCEKNMNMAVRFWHTERDPLAQGLGNMALDQGDDSGYDDE